MREEKFSLQSSLEANYLNVELQDDKQFDDIAVRVIKEDCPEFLIPFRIVDINNKITLKYKLVNTIALEYADKNLSKRAFVGLFLNLLEPFMKGKDWFLDYHFLCIDSRYIFLEKQNSRALFIYVPEASFGNTDEQILKFFQDTFTSITISDDANFQVKLYQFFSRKEITLSDLYQILIQESQGTGRESYAAPAAAENPVRTPEAAPIPAPVPTPVPAAAAPPQGSPLPIPPVNPIPNPLSVKLPFLKENKDVKKENKKEIKKETKKENKMEFQPASNVEYRGATGDADAVVEALFGDKKAKKTKEKPAPIEVPKKKKEASGFALFGKKKPEEINIAPMPQQPFAPVNNMPKPTADPEPGYPLQAVNMPAAEDDRTEIFEQDAPAAAAYLELIESPIPGAVPRIVLDFPKPFIIVGRMSSDEVQPDVAFGKEFSRIGRRHIRLEKRGDTYYVIDLGSVNHTMLNEQVLIPNQAYPLMDGGVLTLTNSKPVRYRIHI